MSLIVATKGGYDETALVLAHSGGRLANSSCNVGAERFYEWHWEMHPMWWWGWGLGMMAMMFLFWALVIIGLIVGIRWLLGRGEGRKAGHGVGDFTPTLRAW